MDKDTLENFEVLLEKLKYYVDKLLRSYREGESTGISFHACNASYYLEKIKKHPMYMR